MGVFGREENASAHGAGTGSAWCPGNVTSSAGQEMLLNAGNEMLEVAVLV